jgi:iron complex transport system substrate-binding protein
MRILSLHPSTTELVFSLGAGNMLVGRTDSCNYPDTARNVPSIGKIEEITAEATALFQPDLILLGEGQEHLRHMGINVILIAPQTMTEMDESIIALGERLGKQVEAEMIIHDLQSTIERIGEKMKRFRAVRIYCETEQGLISASLFKELVVIAGGEPHLGKPSLESIKSFNPQMIIAAAGDDKYLDQIASREGWGELSAIKTERLFRIDEGFLRPTPRIIQGAKALAKITHGVEINGSA